MFLLAETIAQPIPSLTRKVFCLFICLLFTGCASVTSNTASFDAVNFDEHFPGHENIAVVEESTIFYLNDASKEYVRQRSALAAQTRDKALSLISDLFAPSQLALDYVYGANSVAQATFDSGKANCLSLTILAYAMAQEAGMQVTFHEVFQQESWSQMGDFDLANGHVNLKISGVVRNTEVQGLPREKRTYTVDFFPTSREGRYKSQEISKSTIISYFYSNLAAKALVEKDHLVAYANLRKSLTINPNDSSAWNNFGLLLKRQNQWEKAIYAYEQAILLKDDNNSAWENLAALLPKVGDTDRAEDIQRKLQKQRRSNPNFYIRQGNRHLFDGEIDDAEEAFKKSIELENNNHYAWFGLARVSSMKGDREAIIANLKKAQRYGRRDGFSSRYASKIAAVEANIGSE